MFVLKLFGIQKIFVFIKHFLFVTIVTDIVTRKWTKDKMRIDMER